MKFITEFITNFGWQEGLISLAVVLIAIVLVLWVDWMHRQQMKDKFFD